MILYDNRDLLALVCERTGSVLLTRRVLLPATLSTVVCALLLSFPEVKEHVVVTGSVIRIYASIVGYTIVFRTNMAFLRFFEGIEHVMSMFSKWRDACITLCVFIEVSFRDHVRRGNAQKVRDLLMSRARLLHWFSLLTAMACQKLAAAEDGNDLQSGYTISACPATSLLGGDLQHQDARDQEVSGSCGPRVVGLPTPQERDELKAAPDPIMLIIKWIQVEMSAHTVSGHYVVAPPLLSRVYQELSNGMLAFFMAMKIPMVPFPFPFAQFLQYALFAFFVFCPCAVLVNIEPPYATLETTWLCLIMNFMACAGFAALNEVAVELEAPFGEDENDYTLHCEQWATVNAMEDCYFLDQPTDFDISSFGDKVVKMMLDMERRTKASKEEATASARLRGLRGASPRTPNLPTKAGGTPGSSLPKPGTGKDPWAVAQNSPLANSLMATFSSLSTEVYETVQTLHSIAEEQHGAMAALDAKLQRLQESYLGTGTSRLDLQPAELEKEVAASLGIADLESDRTTGAEPPRLRVTKINTEGATKSWKDDFDESADSIGWRSDNAFGSYQCPSTALGAGNMELLTSWQSALGQANTGPNDELKSLIERHQSVAERLQALLPRLEQSELAEAAAFHPALAEVKTAA